MFHKNYLDSSNISSRFDYLVSQGAFKNLSDTGLVDQAAFDISENGLVPSGEFLGKMGMLANANILWLLEGRGSPFAVNRFEDDEEAALYLNELLVEGFYINIVTYKEITSGSIALDWCVVCTLPTAWRFQGRWIEHEHVEVVTGNLGMLTREEIQAVAGTHQITRKEISPGAFRELTHGLAAFDQ